jgi:hypothetical protein
MAFESHFWPMLAAVFAAGWLGGAPAAALWCLIGGYALVDVLRAGGLERQASTESKSAP